jgi:hypothetical protein
LIYSMLGCDHPLFRWSSAGAWNGAPDELQRPYVFVFERRRWLTPTLDEIARYRRDRQTVERLGGTMNRREWEIAGESLPFSASEVQEMIDAVIRDNPGGRFIQHWNGEGGYTLSVGVDMPEGKASQ